MNYLILTEGGGTLGWGHLIRCAALASELNHLSLQGQMMIDWRGEFTTLPELHVPSLYCDWASDLTAIGSLIIDADVVILDSYQCKSCMIDDLLLLNRNVVFFDDYLHRNYPCGMVVDPTPLAERTAYPIRNPLVTYCLGLSWACIRREFSARRLCRLNQDTSHIFLALGAGVALLPECIDAIFGVYPKAQIHVIVRESPFDILPSEKLHIYRNINADALCQVIDLCDFGVVAGGQTLYEVLARCLPVIAFPVVDNQACDVSFFQTLSAVHAVGRDGGWRLHLEKVLHEMTSLEDVIERSSMTNLVDGLGAQRLAKAIVDVFDIHGVIWQ
jgi:spore coat polysaccharide biosynthesis predicted glycosyltransferase SpsG